MKLLSITILVFSFFLFTSCGSFNPFSKNPGPVSKEIGPEGGTITTPDRRLTLSIPAGALGNTETITIEELNPDELSEEYREINAVYKFGPNGLTFNIPATVSYSGVHDPSLLNGNTLEMPVSVIGVVDEFQSEAEILENIEIRDGQLPGVFQVQGELNHFSFVIIEHNDDFKVMLDVDKTELFIGEVTTVSSLLDFFSGTGLEDEYLRYTGAVFFGGLNLISDYEFSEVRYTDLTIENRIRLQPFEPPIVDSPYNHYKLNEFPEEGFSEFLTKEMNYKERLSEDGWNYDLYDYYVNTFTYTCIEAGSPGTEPLRVKVDLEFYHSAFESSRVISLYFGNNPGNTILVQCLSDDEEEDEEDILSEMEDEYTNIGILEGRVFTEDDKGIEGVEVRVELENGNVITQRTDASGNYRFENILDGNATVRIPLPECEQNPREVYIDPFKETIRADFLCEYEKEGEPSENPVSDVKQPIFSNPEIGFDVGVSYRPSLGDYVEDQENLTESDTDSFTPNIAITGKFDILKDFSLPGFKKDNFSLSIGTSISRSKAGFTQTFKPPQGETYVADGKLIVTNWYIFSDLTFAENILSTTNRQLETKASLRFGFANAFNKISIRYRNSDTNEEMEENHNHQSLTLFGGVGADVNLNDNWAVSPFFGYMSGKADANWQGTFGIKHKF